MKWPIFLTDVIVSYFQVDLLLKKVDFMAPTPFWQYCICNFTHVYARAVYSKLCLYFELKLPVTQRLTQPNACYCTLFTISLTVSALMGFNLTSSFVSAWLTSVREGRRCVDKKAHSVLGAWGCVPVKTKTRLQVGSMYVPEFCSWSIWLRPAVCFHYLFLCNYRLAMLKGVLDAGRSALVLTKEFVWRYSPLVFLLPLLAVCLSSALNCCLCFPLIVALMGNLSVKETK